MNPLVNWTGSAMHVFPDGENLTGLQYMVFGMGMSDAEREKWSTSA